jgi:hypothetical protein
MADMTTVAERLAAGTISPDRICTVTSRRGHTVKPHFAIRGGKVCAKHGANLPTVKRAAEVNVQTVRARQLMAAWKIPLDANIDAGVALSEEVTRTYWTVRHYQECLLETDPEAHLVAASSTQRVGGGEYGDWLDTTIEARPSVMLTLYNEERDRLLARCHIAIKLGLRERQQREMERLGEMAAHAMRLALVVDWLTPAQRDQLLESAGRQLGVLAAPQVLIATSKAAKRGK